jgi:hypothetical protein
MINFIGIGAQKSGTSWVYACLYEHPEVCAPIKEIHFFSRPRFSEGRGWYEHHFASCAPGKKQGEFSTSYLYSKDAPERIHAFYPSAKIIAILRNPIDRAYSQYRNSIKAGEIPETISFERFLKDEPSAIEQGRYYEQLSRYDALFPSEQMLVLIYEDMRKDPVSFMRRIYTFLGIDSSFVSSMVYDEINIARTPRHVFIERVMHHVAEKLRACGLDRFVHVVRKSGITDFVRTLNTKSQNQTKHTHSYDRSMLRDNFKDDTALLSKRLERDMTSEWL